MNAFASTHGASTDFWQLLQPFNTSSQTPATSNHQVSGLSLDSRAVNPGDIFFALPGDSADGRQFVPEALARGASAVVVDAQHQLDRPIATDIPVVALDNARVRVGEIASLFFAQPSHSMDVIAVTGTNGKTTCVWLIAKALTSLGHSCASLGTLGLLSDKAQQATGLTTPDAISVHRSIAALAQDEVRSLAMEASSHALVQHRLAGVDIDIAVLTNVSHDHLDYHKSLDAYVQAKKMLFAHPGLDVGIINRDDAMADEFLQACRCDRQLTFSLQSPDADIHLIDHVSTPMGVQLKIQSPAGVLDIKSPLVGRFNTANLLAVVAVLFAMDKTVEEMSYALSQVKPAPGRMEIYRSAQAGPTVVVDFAHTPDALKQALNAVVEHCSGEITCVFGCGGDRDKDKRPLMGRIAEQLADRLIITNDNPRGEDPHAIVNEIQAGMLGSSHVELSRGDAIRLAIDSANEDDWVLIAGKGHETVQIIGDQHVSFSDREVVKAAMGIGS